MFVVKEYEINGTPLSKWTNEFLEKCEEIRGEDLSDEDIIYLLDYAVGFGLTDDVDQVAEQTVEAVFND